MTLVVELLVQASIGGLLFIGMIGLAMKPAVVRELRTPQGILAVLTLPAAGAALVWLLATVPAARRPVTLVAAVGLLLAWWRARPGYGSRRGLPRGSLSVGRSLDAIHDRSFYRDEARRHGPIFKMSQFGRPVACVVGIQRARRVLVDQADRLSGATLPYNRFVPRGSLRYMARSDHRDVAPVFRAALARMDISAAETDVREALRAGLERLVSHREACSGLRVRPRDYWGSLILPALAHTVFGLDPAHPGVSRIGSELQRLDLGRGGGPIWRRRVRQGLERTRDALHDALTDRGPRPGSALAHLLAAEPALFSDPTLSGNLVLISRLALGDLTGLYDWIFRMLTDHRSWLARLREEGPSSTTVWLSGCDPQALPLAPCIVMETLRLEQSEFLYRKIVRPVWIEGRLLPAGWLLRVCIQESHRAADVFGEPDRFDPDRFTRRAFVRTEYAPFGIDSHACMGTKLTLALGALFVEELARFDWQVLRDGPVERDGNRHRYHWRPSRRLRVRMWPAREVL
jgi:cytochrome P450